MKLSIRQWSLLRHGFLLFHSNLLMELNDLELSDMKDDISIDSKRNFYNLCSEVLEELNNQAF